MPRSIRQSTCVCVSLRLYSLYASSNTSSLNKSFFAQPRRHTHVTVSKELIKFYSYQLGPRRPASARGQKDPPGGQGSRTSGLRSHNFYQFWSPPLPFHPLGHSFAPKLLVSLSSGSFEYLSFIDSPRTGPVRLCTGYLILIGVVRVVLAACWVTYKNLIGCHTF